MTPAAAGGTAFHFLNDGIAPALDQAREAAGDLDVRLRGGGATILAYVKAGLIDEFAIAPHPAIFAASANGAGNHLGLRSRSKRSG